MGEILKLSLQRSDEGLFTILLNALKASAVQRVVLFTFWQALLSTLLTLVLGLPGAYLLARFQFRGKKILKSLTAVPFVLPTLVVAAAFNAMLGPRGWLNLGLMSLFDLTAPPIDFMNSFAAILLAHVFYNTTIVLRMVGDYWERLDTRVQQAARCLGAGPFQVWWRITLPMLLPALAAAALLVFIFNFSSFGVVLVLGGPQFATLEVEIFYQTISLFNLPLAAVLSLLQLGVTLALTIVYARLNKRVSRPMQLRRPMPQTEVPNWSTRLLVGGMAVLFTGLFLLPLVSLASRSVLRLEADKGQLANSQSQGFTMEFYSALGENPRDSFFYASPLQAVQSSLVYAAATVTVSLLIGFPAAWALSRYPKNKLSQLFDPLLMLPLGTSAVTLGLGFIVALDKPPLDLRSSPLLIPLAHSLVALPFVVRSLSPALSSIQPSLRQAAAILGASPWRAFKEIDLPLIGRALLASALFAFTISIGEFGATALVSRPENPTIPVMIYRFLSQPGGLNYGQAMALSTILMLTTVGAMLAIENLRIAEINEF